MRPSECPSPWVHNPSGFRVKSWSDLPVKNVWKNPNTDEILIQFSAIVTVDDNKTVEVHQGTENAKNVFEKLQAKVGRDVDGSIDQVTVTGGRTVEKCRSNSEALQAAMKYMEENS